MKKLYFIIITLSIFHVSCEEEYFVDNLHDHIFILGHGGMGISVAHYPMNSYQGIQRAIDLGADGSEIDIQITKDSVLVCFHDKYLEPATNKSGAIHTQNWDDIKDATYNASPYKIYKIISLDQLFEYSHSVHKFYTFDIKFNNPDQSNASRDIFHRALIRLIEKYKIEESITIESPDPDFLVSLREKKPGLKLFIYNDYDEAIQIAIDHDFAGIIVRADEITAQQVAEAHDHNIMVAVFSATRRNQNEIIKKNVDIIQSDDLVDLLSRLK